MKKSNFKPQYISRKSYLADSTLVINPSKTKPKLSRTPKLLSSFVIASGLIGLMFFSLNVEAKPIRYECTDTNVVGLGGLMKGNVQGSFMLLHNYRNDKSIHDLIANKVL